MAFQKKKKKIFIPTNPYIFHKIERDKFKNYQNCKNNA